MTDKTSPMPAGWHPDPAGQPGQRYHDGKRWTEHFVPTPPVNPMGPAVAVAVSASHGTNHALHAVLTVMSCGLWLPIWILTAVFSTAGSAATSVAIGPGGATAKAGTRKFMPLMFFGAWMALGAICMHPSLLMAVLVLAGVGGGAFWLMKSRQLQGQQGRRMQFERDMMADRAEREDRLFNAGDPRGTYGQYMP